MVITALDVLTDNVGLVRLLFDFSRMHRALQGIADDMSARAALSLIEEPYVPSNLTVTVGYGASLLDKARAPEARSPASLVAFMQEDLPGLGLADDGGDIILQICADSPTAAWAAARSFVSIAAGRARTRWTHFGSIQPAESPERAPRNHFGFDDGLVDSTEFPGDGIAEHVFVGQTFGSFGWLTGASFLVFRKMPMLTADWDAESVAKQERILGRDKKSGALLPMAPGSPAGEIPHAQLMKAGRSDGTRLLRRPYPYRYGSSPGEPPDSGMLFISYQRELQQFTRLRERMAAHDALNRYVRDDGGCAALCPSDPWLLQHFA
jgi:deferrochelatase/peroxidase EfeB